jgi:hypothetical protein
LENFGGFVGIRKYDSRTIKEVKSFGNFQTGANRDGEEKERRFRFREQIKTQKIS